MSRFRVLVTARAFQESAPESEMPVRKAGGEVFYPPQMGPLPPQDLIPHLQLADAVIASTDLYTAEVLQQCPRLRVIVRWGTGYDTLDLNACTTYGVVACNTPGLNVEAVADWVFCVMLALARRLPYQLDLMRRGEWEEVRGRELYRKTLGIVGFGAIGRAVARRAQGFDCRILAYDPYISEELFLQYNAQPVDLETLFGEADFVTVHAVLTSENRGMIGADLLRRMKPTAYFINSARGLLIDESALLQGLTEGWIAGAALDTFVQEPLPPDHPLRFLPNCIVTPHSAFNTLETAEATNRAVAETLLAVLRGEQPPNVLNPEVYNCPQFRGKVPFCLRD